MEKQLILPQLMNRGIDEMPNERCWMVTGREQSDSNSQDVQNDPGSLTRPKHTSDPPPKSKRESKRTRAHQNTTIHRDEIERIKTPP